MSEKDENILNEEQLAEEQAETEKSSDKKSQKRWYIVHTYSGYENKEIGRASVGKECVRRCRSRWSPYH